MLRGNNTPKIGSNNMLFMVLRENITHPNQISPKLARTTFLHMCLGHHSFTGALIIAILIPLKMAQNDHKPPINHHPS